MCTMTEEFLRKVFTSLKDMVSALSAFGDVRSVVVFGSAARLKDFVKDISDIDVLVITRKRPRIPHYGFEVHGAEVSITIMSLDDVRKIFESGHPLAFMLYKYTKVLVDDGTFSTLISTIKPKVTERTLRILRHSTFVALGLGLEKYFAQLYREAISHAYHAVRHMVRYKACLKGVDANNFPISDDEVKSFLPEYAKGVFEKLVELRRRKIGKEDCMNALEDSRKLISSEMGCCIPSFRDLEQRILEENGHIVSVMLEEKTCSVEVSCIVRVDSCYRTLVLKCNNK
ncbi:MAG: hypothetical protein DRZ82_02295 [Thermoprotei archaeon]|nr:MAG: hypothetical protein DRZ82_02295 [Thermoprotei archaeon]